MKKIIAVDFDGTLVEDAYPNIGKLNDSVVQKVREAKEKGYLIGIWTCRCGKDLEEAIKTLNDNNIPYDGINEKLESPFPDDPRKIFAHQYWDDKAINVKDIHRVNLDTLELDYDFSQNEMIKDIERLVCKIYELAIHSVEPNLGEVRDIVEKYGLGRE